MVKFAVITETDIFGKEQKKRKKKKEYNGKRIQDFSELSIGDFVVHEKHGLGIYRGIEKVAVDKVAKDYIKIEYRNGSNLYILATQLDALQKYSGAETAKPPKLNRLGGQEWKKTKSKVKGAVRNIARELVELYAVRQEKEGYVCGPDTVWQRDRGSALRNRRYEAGHGKHKNHGSSCVRGCRLRQDRGCTSCRI